VSNALSLLDLGLLLRRVHDGQASVQQHLDLVGGKAHVS
jgi:hypothetical protein